MNFKNQLLFRKCIFSTFLLLLCCGSLAAQTVKGHVYGSRPNGGREALPMANVYWMGGNQVVQTDERGSFSIDRRTNASRFLIASFIGYVSDTLEVVNPAQELVFILREQNELDAAVVTARQQGNLLSRSSPIRTEVITTAGLQKMACCNLAESFENSASVSVGYADAVTGARQIRLLGLSGIYVQMSDENRPSMRGLLNPFGLGFVSGQWLESIQIAKGPGSVMNGYEAITGQINMEFRKPPVEQPLFINLFFANSLRSEANIASSLQLNHKWSTVLLGHFSTDPQPHDGNHDGFLDEPLTFQYNFANRWLHIADNGVQWRFGFRALYETRDAGQSSHITTHRPEGMEDMPLWKSNIKNQGINLYSKLAIPLKRPGTETSAVAPNVALVFDYTHHALDAYFGLKDRNYDAKENSVFANLMFQFGIKEAHRFNLGLSGFYDHLDEDLSLSFANPSLEVVHPFAALGRKEHAWGAYGEYTFNQENKFLFVLGSRLDYNNLYGWLFSPRANVKYDFTENLIFRASGGKGYRTPNLIADNLGNLSTGRWLRIDDNLNIEQAWTYGLNLTGYFNLGRGEKSSLSFDYFRTDFQKQVMVDQERDLDYVWFYNLDGPSYTNTFQVDLTLEPLERFSILTTFRHTDARVHLAQFGTVERPLMSKYKGVFNVQYATRMSKWVFDVTAQLNGPSRLPYFVNATAATPESVKSNAEYSPTYPMLYAQVTRKFRDLDIYLGGENLTNYKQSNPILHADHPFSRKFNATVIWGPLMGMKVYAGLRYTLFK
ncbi:MAG: TonB-dependent receptor [Bacteroidales bacterium]|nr:TonB-dependent receptor [Bacteroidales bacterium]MCL2738202.1 TonB-dependent receptor [Bacteroidales bacterium]